MNDLLLKCQNISCVRGGRKLFYNLSFTVSSGTVILISGKNGSGKTSLLNIIAGILPAYSGSITLEDGAVINDDYCSCVTYIAHKNACSDSLTVFENIEFWADLRNSRELIAPAICYFELQTILDRKYSCLSMGWKRRVALSRLLIFNTNIWLIDEPFVNLDDSSCSLISNLIVSRLERNGIVIITDHSKSIQFPNCKLIEIANFV